MLRSTTALKSSSSTAPSPASAIATPPSQSRPTGGFPSAAFRDAERPEALGQLSSKVSLGTQPSGATPFAEQHWGLQDHEASHLLHRRVPRFVVTGSWRLVRIVVGHEPQQDYQL